NQGSRPATEKSNSTLLEACRCAPKLPETNALRTHTSKRRLSDLTVPLSLGTRTLQLEGSCRSSDSTLKGYSKRFLKKSAWRSLSSTSNRISFLLIRLRLTFWEVASARLPFESGTSSIGWRMPKATKSAWKILLQYEPFAGSGWKRKRCAHSSLMVLRNGFWFGPTRFRPWACPG